MSARHSVFLSYASDDREVAAALAKGLAASNIDVWCDVLPGRLRPGMPWVQQLEEALKSCASYLILVGRRGIDRWLRAELDYALTRQALRDDFHIIPLLLDGVDPEALPPFLTRCQAVRLPAEVDRAGNELFGMLAAELLGRPQAQAQPAGGADDEVVCPFPGLEVFEEEQARFFFGRDTEVREIAERLGRTPRFGHRRWLQIEGGTGTGKSSLARAGLLPAVRRGWIEGAPRHWQVAVFRPGRDPVLNLGEAVARALDRSERPLHLQEIVSGFLRDGGGLRDLLREQRRHDHGFLLVVDQMEEAFILGGENPERTRRFDELLAVALDDTDGPLYLVTTIRSDFIGRFLELPLLEEGLNEKASRYYLKPMSEKGLREAVGGPARLSGLSFDRGLPERIVADALEAEGGLPLLGHVLRALWEARSVNLLTNDVYQSLGGVGGALSRSADGLLATLGPAGRGRARRLLLRLVQIGRGTQDTRRPVTRAEALVSAGGGTDGERVLARLSGGRDPDAPDDAPAPLRLIMVSGRDDEFPAQHRVELVHEALIRRWNTLRGWIDEDRMVLESRDDLEAAAHAWESAGYPEDGLPQGAQFAYFRRADPAILSRLGRRFVVEAARLETRREEDRRRREDEQASARASARLRRQTEVIAVLGAAVVFLVGATGVMGWFFDEARSAQRAERESRERAEAAVQAERGDRVTILAQQPGREIDALVAGIQAVAPSLRSGGAPPAQALEGIAAATASGRYTLPLRGHGGAVVWSAFSPRDGLRVATASVDHTAAIWDARSGELLFRLEGHRTDVTGGAFSPDGSRLVTGSSDGSAMLWDAHTGGLLATLQGHTGPLASVAFSHDGTRIVTASGDGTARIWDGYDGQPLARLEGHTAIVTGASFSRDGTRVVTASRDRTARIFDARLPAAAKGAPASARLIAVLPVRTGEVISAAFSDDGHRIVTVDDEVARIWDARTGRAIAVLRGHTDPVGSAAFSPDGARVLTTSSDDTARIFEAASGRTLVTLHGHTDQLTGGEFSPMGDRVLTSGMDNTARIWDAGTGALLATLRGHTHRVARASFSPDGTRVVTASWDDTARIWDPRGGQPIATLPGDRSGVDLALFSPNGAAIVTGNREGVLRVWDEATLPGEPLALLKGQAPGASRVAFSPDGARLIAAGSDGVARLWEARSGAPLAVVDAHDEGLLEVAFSPAGAPAVPPGAGLPDDPGLTPPHPWLPGGPWLVTASDDGVVFLRDGRTGERLVTLRGHTAPAVHATFSPDGARLLTVARDGRGRVWEALSGRLLGTLDHRAPVTAAAFSPDGERLVTAGAGAVARLWRTNGLAIATLEGHAKDVTWAAFSPDGSRLVTASWDSTARLWDGRTGAVLAVLRGHAGAVNTAAFSPDSTRVVTASVDRTARLWDARPDHIGEPLALLQGHADAVQSAVFSPNGTRVLTASLDGTARLYPATAAGFFAVACQLLRHQQEFEQVRNDCAPYLDRTP